MEAEMGPQVVVPPPSTLHQPAAALFHGLPASDRRANPSHKHDRLDPSSSPGSSSSDPSSSNWSPDMWRWDPVTFTAKPSSFVTADRGAHGEARVGNGEMDASAHGLRMASTSGNQSFPVLKLSNSSRSSTPGDSAARPSKKVRAESPEGSSSRNKQMCCQVDDCNVDLAKQRDYHRRHKVCETHSKAVNALVGKQMQRFCQQCSRFHPLADFDEGKRSCRSRLAGHNRRRRKIRPEEGPSMPAVSSDHHDGNASMSSKIVNVLAILARIQDSNSLVMSAKSSRVADANCLDEVVGTLNSLHTSYSKKDLPISEKFDLNVSHDPPKRNNTELPPDGNNGRSISTSLNLCTVTSNYLSTTKVDGLNPASPVTHSSTDDKAEKNSVEPYSDVSSDNNSTLTVPSDGLNRDKDALPSTSEVAELIIDESRPTLQLFDPSKDDLSLNTKFMSSSGVTRTMEKQCPSRPVTHNLFPLCPMTQTSENVAVPAPLGENEMVDQNIILKQNPSFEIFKDSVNRAGGSSSQLLPCMSSLRASHLCSAPDLSQMDRSGRILFKLFDKHPSDIPNTIRSQILNWLSHSPSDMESYIRPGCIVLSVYLSMPSLAWDALQKNLVGRLLSLLHGSDFWSSGRLLVDVDRKLAFHNNGKVGLCKHRKNRSAPELLVVSPLAIVSGTETKLLLHGRNLRLPGTKIHCTNMGGYISKEVSGYHSPGTADDKSSLETFVIPGGRPGYYGRCFIEVEHRSSGNSFPVIIADSAICKELVELEVELEGARNMILERSESDFVGLSLREDILYFLEELGWLFQRSNTESTMYLRQFSVTRSVFLVLFAVERGWCALLKRLLDIFVQMSLDEDNLATEFLKAVNEVHLLSRAVKGKCQKMVDMLLHYSINGRHASSKVYPFPPNAVGVGGITPLHVAASMENSEDMIDALTNDPQGVGLPSWKCIVDDGGQSPHDYASLRNYHTYNKLVEGKVQNRRNSGNEGSSNVVITIYEEDIPSSANSDGGRHPVQSGINPSPVSCSQCAVLENRQLRRIIQTKSMKYRPYAHSLLAIAMVCMCVCLFLRGKPEVGLVAPFKWKNIEFGTM